MHGCEIGLRWDGAHAMVVYDAETTLHANHSKCNMSLHHVEKQLLTEHLSSYSSVALPYLHAAASHQWPA